LAAPLVTFGGLLFTSPSEKSRILLNFRICVEFLVQGQSGTTRATTEIMIVRVWSSLTLFSYLCLLWSHGVQLDPTAWTNSSNLVPWFLAFSSTINAAEYEAFAAAAILSAKENAANLEPHLLYIDGAESNFTQWCEEQGVVVHLHTLTFDSPFSNAAKMVGGNSMYYSMAKGAFARLDVAHIYRAWGGQSEYVLYTDCDVLFFSNPVPFTMHKASVVAIGPQHVRGTKTNTGVLWIHVDRWLAVWPTFRRYLIKQNWTGHSFEQELFLDFFQPFSAQLDDAWNYKPYWQAVNETIVIGHFHGPKPKRCLDEYIFASVNTTLCDKFLLKVTMNWARKADPFIRNYKNWIVSFIRFYNMAVSCNPMRKTYFDLPSFIPNQVRPCRLHSTL